MKYIEDIKDIRRTLTLGELVSKLVYLLDNYGRECPVYYAVAFDLEEVKDVDVVNHKTEVRKVVLK